MYAELNYYRKTEKRKVSSLSIIFKFGVFLLATAYLLVKVIEPVLASGTY